MKTVKKSIFGKKIDERCPGYTLFQKCLVFLGIFADAYQNEVYSQIDTDLRKKEGRYV